jgi:hypothetical protein
MTHQPVTSSNLRSVAYDPLSKQMHVTFHSGKTYAYHDVPAHVHLGLMMAPSKGAHFGQHIKGKFRTVEHKG